MEDFAFAACDRHLAAFMRNAIAGEQTQTVRVTHLERASDTYTCGCGVPAHWFVRAKTSPDLTHGSTLGGKTTDRESAP